MCKIISFVFLSLSAVLKNRKSTYIAHIPLLRSMKKAEYTVVEVVPEYLAIGSSGLLRHNYKFI